MSSGKKQIVIGGIVIIGILVVGGIFYASKTRKPVYEFIVAEKNDLVQEVSVTGRVQPAESVDLAFETAGKVSQVAVAIGDKVKARQLLVRLESSELSAQLREAIANLEIEQATLRELQEGTRPEEIQIAKTKVNNAQRAIESLKQNLENVQEKAAADLQKAYDDALTAAQTAVTVGKTALLTLTDIQYAYFVGTDQDSATIANAKAQAVVTLLGAEDAGRWVTDFLSTLDGGAFGVVQSAISNPSHASTDGALIEARDGLSKVKDALGSVPVGALTSTEKTDLGTEKNNITSQLATLSAKQQAIAVQKATNASAVASAEAQVTDAQNTYDTAQDDLTLKRAGTVPEKILAQKAKVQSVEAHFHKFQAQIAKTQLTSPIDGIVTKQDAKVGEIVAANTSIVSLISEAIFEIEADIPEADIAKLHVGDQGKVTLDAYGPDLVFDVTVIAIDPAETIIEGVATYQTTLQFVEEDERIRSGMTANIEILTARREGVIAVPQRAVITKDGRKVVRVLKGEEILEVEVQTGLRGSDGNVEIVEGVGEGERVIIFLEERNE